MNRRTAFTLVELLVVVAIIAVLVTILLPAVQSAREAARRTQCLNRLKQIGLAMMNFESATGHLPTGEVHGPDNNSSGNRRGFGHCGWYSNIGSWTTDLMPYLELQAAYDLLDFTTTPSRDQFSHEGNLRVIKMRFEEFLCPSDPYDGLIRYGWDMPEERFPRVQHYFPVSGPFKNHDAFDGPDAQCNCADCCPHLGAFWNDSEIKLRQVTDGMSKTAMFAETWGRQEHGPFDGNLPNGVAMPLHNRVYFNVPINDISRDGGIRRTRPHAVTSWHVGGAYLMFGDVSVRFASESIDFDLFQNMATIAGDGNLDERLRARVARGF